MPMTIRQIMQATPPSRRQAAEWVKITGMKVKKSPQGYPLVLAQTIASHDNKGVRKSPQPNHRYVTHIEVQGKYVVVGCSCDDFLYTFEYALAKRGAANIEYSNGEKPVDRNPKLIPGACVARGSKVMTDLGNKLIEDIKVGDRVLTLMGYQAVTACQLTEQNAKILMLNTRSGMVQVTPDHLVLAITQNVEGSDGMTAQWVAAEALELGDRLISLVPSEEPNTDKVTAEPVVYISSFTSDVFDLTVENAEHFTANSFLVHNCKHIFAVAEKLIDSGKI